MELETRTTKNAQGDKFSLRNDQVEVMDIDLFVQFRILGGHTSLDSSSNNSNTSSSNNSDFTATATGTTTSTNTTLTSTKSVVVTPLDHRVSNGFTK